MATPVKRASAPTRPVVKGVSPTNEHDGRNVRNDNAQQQNHQHDVQRLQARRSKGVKGDAAQCGRAAGRMLLLGRGWIG